MTESVVPPDTQRLIADAVHHAVSKLFDPSILHIAPINTIGCFLLQHLFGRDFRPVCGSVRLHTGGQTFGIEAAVDKLDEHEYYLWIESHEEEGPVELIDFGARYWPEWAQGMGVLWLGERPPSAIWMPKAAVPGALVEYATDPEVTQTVQNSVGRAIVHRQPEGLVEAWEKAINDAVDYLATTEGGMEFLVQAGLAEPLEE